VTEQAEGEIDRSQNRTSTNPSIAEEEEEEEREEKNNLIGLKLFMLLSILFRTECMCSGLKSREYGRRDQSR
jgi:hypothetical protein